MLQDCDKWQIAGRWLPLFYVTGVEIYYVFYVEMDVGERIHIIGKRGGENLEKLLKIYLLGECKINGTFFMRYIL